MLDAAETAPSDFDAVADWEIDATVSAGDHFLGCVGRGRMSVVLHGAAGSPHDPKDDQQQTYPEQVFHGLRGGFRFPQSIAEACSIVTGGFAVSPGSYVLWKEKSRDHFGSRLFSNSVGRGERIRTSDSYVPNVVLYQAELRPDRGLQLLKRPINCKGRQF